ncbi:bacterio-opsin activator-like protein [Natrinema pallidum DSM 3751]|uniref:Bacterio-opsin activator-like protein n=1 Tax=Natrinema pallidum DSM 3751 TaxID=1227495 RepID=L9Z9G5_9EURY|nr:bacterio-opsin activator domain-containing protein [Natrinema pallidum]ELY82606.1 bacterio-opsin activator-like protein [Natrinema pallidum DSM 3751]
MFYGTLTVYSTQTEAFDDRTKDVLEEFGTLIGYARNAVEQRNALFGSEMVDLSFEIDLESDDVIRSIASELGTTVEIQNVNRRNQNSYLVHCSIPDADPGEVTELSDCVAGLDAVQPLSKSSSSTFELIVVNECIATETNDLGAVLRSIQVTEQACDIVFSVPRHRDHRRFSQQVRDQFSGVSLTAKRQSSPAGSISRTSLFDAVLSEKQTEVLTAAYHSGYFDKTRKQTGAEIADALGIAQPTFSKRLRAAQHDLLASVIDGDRSAGE